MYISLIIKEILIYFLFTIVNKKPRNNKIISPQILQKIIPKYLPLNKNCYIMQKNKEV